MNSEIQKYFDVFKILESDIQISVEVFNSDKGQFGYNARAYMRSYASWVEGTIWIYKKMITGCEDEWYKSLPLESQLYLFEIDWNVKGSGKPEVKNKKIRTKDNIKAFFVVMGQLFDDFSISFTDREWEDVLFFYSLRDRMMHPTSLDSLEISKNDIKRCEDGRVWLRNKISEISQLIIDQCRKCF